ncbi:MAG: adenylate/guanylate cyclase domain-containing protein [Acidimicrobiia bacterium]|nr:adenylate/guanylate cyclase domain-containing protein [Acidimicrobiia bacterium]
MHCHDCGTAVTADQKFCAECGASLQRPCPSCGHVNPPGNKFCPECGSALVEAAPAAEAPAPAVAPTTPERRFVSVLFADLVGFTPFSEGRDAEEVRDLLTRYFDASRAIVERYSGVVDKFIGDAVMAVWGAVEAHEDDAERAVRAALELVDAVSALGQEIGVPELRLRAGVLSGETSVGPGGNDRGLVVGDLVNTASRLQSIAEPGSVFIGGPTYELVRHVVECSPHGVHDLKGKAEPVAVHRAERVIAGHGGRRRADAVEPPFVGREDELRLIKDQLDAVARDRRARMVSVVGDGGIGKSRLAWEFFKYVDGLPELTYWHQGRSPAYGEGLPLWSLGEIVRQRCGIAETDDPAKSRMKLRTALAEYVGDDEERRWMEPWLAGLLGLDPMPDGDRAELFAAIRLVVQRVAERGQTVLVFEDLHWADDGVLEFVEDLLERSVRHPILVITLARPELLDRHPGWGSGRHVAASMRLVPLSDAAMRALVSGMIPGIRDDVVALVVERAAGIPLYAVEFVRMLLTSGDVVREGDRYRMTGDADDLAVPDSLQAVIGARLDRLDAAERALVQDAAVLGQSFPLEGLIALRGGGADETAAAMRDLVRKELFNLNDDPRSPERGQYSFVQSVVREVAYGRLSRADRYEAHLRVAEYFEDLDDPELAAAVAAHLLAARDAGTGAGKGFVDRALSALRRAIDRAASLHAHRQVLDLCEQAIAMADDDAQRVPFWERAASSAGMAAEADLVTEYGARAIAHHEASGDIEGRMRASRIAASQIGGQFRSDRSLALLRPVYDDMDPDDRSEEAVRFLAEMGRALMLNNEAEESIVVCDRALVAAEQREMVDTIVDACITKGTALGNLGRRQESAVVLRGAALLAEDHDLLRLIIRATNNLAVVLQESEPRMAMEIGRTAHSYISRVGDRAWELQWANNESDRLLGEGDLAGARAVLGVFDGSDVAPFWQAVGAVRRATADAVEGDPEGPGRIATAVEMFDETEDVQLKAALRLMRANGAHLGGDPESVRELSKPVLADGIHSMWAMAALVRAAWMARDAEWAREARGLLDDTGIPGRYPAAVRAWLDGIEQAVEGHTEAAVASFTTAVDLIDRVSNPLEAAEVRASFADLVGVDHPAAATALAEARAWTESMGIGVFARLLPDLFADPPLERSGIA